MSGRQQRHKAAPPLISIQHLASLRDRPHLIKLGESERTGLIEHLFARPALRDPQVSRTPSAYFNYSTSLIVFGGGTRSEAHP